MSFYPSTFSEQQGQNDIWMYPDDDSKCSPTGREGGKVANTRGRRMRQREREREEKERDRDGGEDGEISFFSDRYKITPIRSL